MSEEKHSPWIPEGIRFAKFNVVDLALIRANEETQRQEDAVIFHAIALAVCPEGCVYIWDEKMHD